MKYTLCFLVMVLCMTVQQTWAQKAPASEQAAFEHIMTQLSEISKAKANKNEAACKQLSKDLAAYVNLTEQKFPDFDLGDGARWGEQIKKMKRSSGSPTKP